MFWRDEPVVKVAKVKPKVTPPEPTWLSPDYLPGLEEALAFNVPLLTTEDLWALRGRDRLQFDVEVYRNYFAAGFKSERTKKYLSLETDENGQIDINVLGWVMTNFLTVGFNSRGYDLPMVSLILAGCSTEQVKEASDRIIVGGEYAYNVLRSYKTKILDCNHIDLMEVAPLRASLKIYGGRVHVKRMQDLPFEPATILSPPQKAITRFYNLNDLDTNEALDSTLDEQLSLREEMGKKYGIDLRSKSDAQIAEHVITSEVEKLLGRRVARPQIMPGTAYRFKTPPYLKFQSALLQYALGVVERAAFIVADHGSIEMPPELSTLKLEINKSTYQMGIGGLHSTESKVRHVADDEYEIWDFDVTSYYPRIILNQGLAPYHMGPAFLRVYNQIVETRIAAKRRGDKVAAESLKIVVNGSYGKLGSKYSNLYAPDLLVQVTLTGQLALLLLIERFELAGIQVVSGNTDGIVVKPRKYQVDWMHAIVKQWEADTRFEMEGTQYLSLNSRDVNTYIAVKRKFDEERKVWLNEADGIKAKGALANPWSQSKNKANWLHINPTNIICLDAIEALLTKGVPVVNTIHASRDIRKFVNVRTVTGGAVKDGQYLGKAIRWYYGAEEKGAMVYAKSGKKVPRSDGAVPLLTLPDRFPDDVNFEWYVNETDKLLKEIGYL